MDRNEFQKQLEDLRKEIFNAIVTYEVYIATWPTEDAVDIINRYKSFFFPVRISLYNMFMLGFRRIFDRDPRTMSLHNLLIEAQTDTFQLVPHLDQSDIQVIQAELSQHNKTLTKIKDLCDQYLAHRDANPKLSDLPQKAEVDALMNTIEKAFNKLSEGHHQTVTSYDFAKRQGAWITSEVLRVLKEDMDKQQSETQRLLDLLENP